MKYPPVLVSVIGFFAALAGFGYLFFGLRVLGFDWFGALGDLPVFQHLGLWGWLAIATGHRLAPRRARPLGAPAMGSHLRPDHRGIRPLRGGPGVLPVPGDGHRLCDGDRARPDPLVHELRGCQGRVQGGRFRRRLHLRLSRHPRPSQRLWRSHRRWRPRPLLRSRSRRRSRLQRHPLADEPVVVHHVNVEDVEGIGPAYGEKLATVGIKTTDDLLMAGAKPYDRERIAEQTGISGKLIGEWVDKVDLMRVPGVGPQYSDLLEAAGVGSPAELAQRNPANLAITCKRSSQLDPASSVGPRARPRSRPGSKKQASSTRSVEH